MLVDLLFYGHDPQKDMVTGVIAKKKRLRKIEVFIGCFVVFVFLAVSAKYYVNYYEIEGSLRQIFWDNFLAKAPFFRVRVNCLFNQIKVELPDSEICRNPLPDSVYLEIYDTHALKPSGLEVVYRFMEEGTIEDANLLLEGKYPIERFQPADIGTPTWTEDPYHDEYWRFLFYSMRYGRNLLYAYKQTENGEYLDKLRVDVNDFVGNGMNKSRSWDDWHAVAFRTMMLVQSWVRLRADHKLTAEESTEILKVLQVHGDFLADRNHYQVNYNHGLNESLALYLLAVNFPELPNATAWRSVAEERLEQGIDSLIDSDGVLIENSPYYHFYTLEKYWDIFSYLKKHNLVISKGFDAKIRSMVTYAAYILQPNLHVPLLGASIDRKMSFSNFYKEIAKEDPHLRYVLTKGNEGSRPSKLNIYFPSAGQTIMRSGWERGSDFSEQTQVIFDVGPYRTTHSDFDALSFSLYGAGQPLMPDSGLYTYDPGIMRQYFHGTGSHNTVTVDGANQKAGTAYAGKLVEGGDFVYQAAVSKLYPGVTHNRALMLIQGKYLVVIDRLKSNIYHNYSQMFHLDPSLEIDQNGLDIVGKTRNGEQKLKLQQIVTSDIKLAVARGEVGERPAGLCSSVYNKAEPCYQLSFTKWAKEAQFISLIEIGDNVGTPSARLNGDELKISIEGSNYYIQISEDEGSPEHVELKNFGQPEVQKISPIDDLKNLGNWTDRSAGGSGRKVVVGEGLMTLTTPTDGSEIVMEKNTQMDLSNSNLLIKMRMEGRGVADKIEVSLSTNNWSGYATINLFDDYRLEYEKEWVSASIGKGLRRNSGGQWRFYGNGFDWSDVDGIRIKVSSVRGASAKFYLEQLATVKIPDQYAIVFVFDDGYESILPAIDYMTNYGIKGNVAVIADRVHPNTQTRGYLSIEQLRYLKDVLGWGLVNHSQHHVDANIEYSPKQDMEGFEEDVVGGMKFLIDNDLNNVPNWYIYPHGSTNGAMKAIVSKYYKFARTTQSQPESYPFGDRYGVKTLPTSAEGGESDSLGLAPEKIINAIEDAKTYNLTLLLTFHRIHDLPTDRPGYEMKDFEKIVRYISENNIKVITLAELDNLMGVPETEQKVFEAIPPQLDLKVKTRWGNLLQKLWDFD